MKKSFHEKLLERAKQFLKDALYDAECRRYDIAIVHLEQALQLLLKAKIYERFGEFPITHNLKILLRTLGEAELVDKRREVINLLESAYLAGRYYDIGYEKEDFEIVFKFVKEVFEKYGIKIN